MSSRREIIGMVDLLKYYLLTLSLYVFEIFLFKTIYPSWEYDLFWLNTIVRLCFVIFFAIVIRNIIFKEADNFYLKFSILIIINPILASSVLKIFSAFYFGVEILILKFGADLISSLIIFFILKRIT